MQYFMVGRQRMVTENILVLAENAAQARSNADKGHLVDVVNGMVVQGSTIALPYDGFKCKKNEQVFMVTIAEHHKQKALVVAKDSHSAILSIREGDGMYLHKSECEETGDIDEWSVETA